MDRILRAFYRDEMRRKFPPYAASRASKTIELPRHTPCVPRNWLFALTSDRRETGRDEVRLSHREENRMNKDIMQGKWKEMKGKVKEQWGKLTDDDLNKIDGKSEQLVGLLQQRYGYARERAEEEYKRFSERWSHQEDPAHHATPHR